MSKLLKPGKTPAAPDHKSPAGNTTADTLFKKLIENSQDGLTLLDHDLQVIYRSTSAERINGWTAADRAKYNMDELIHPDDRILVKSVINKVKARPGNIELCQFRSMRFSGHYIWIECTFTNFLNDPDINAIVCNFRDITERKLYEEKIIESGRFTKTITDNLPALIAYFNSDSICLFANKPYMEWFEKQPHEILGVNKQDILGQEEFELHEAHINEVLKGKPQRFERTFHKTDSRTIDTDTQYLPDIEGDKVKGFYSLIYDVTEVKRAEQEVSKKNAQIENILDNITDGFITLDQNRRYTYANKQIGLMIGREPASLIGKNIWDVFPDAIGSATYDAIETAFAENKYVCNEDYYEPLGLCQENRVYPAGKGISMFIRDISERKNEELRKSLLSDISLFFNEEVELNETLQMVLERLVEFTNFSMAEAWLIGVDKNKIQLAARFTGTATMQVFYDESAEIKSLVKGQGLPGIVWETRTVKFWSDVHKNKQFIRHAAAKKAGLRTVYGIPLQHNNEIIGVLMLGSVKEEKREAGFTKSIESIGNYMAAEIKRKQLERELNQIFNFAPDIICIAGVDGYFKKVNPAMCALLEYTEEELLAKPYVEFVHPDDRRPTVTEVKNVFDDNPSMNFQNRYITRTGKIKVLSWTATGASDDSLLFCVAKDVTEKKNLEELLNKATTLARIGSWEVNVVNDTIYWSDITREIHEAAPGYHPDIEAAVNFYKKGINREIIVKTMENAIINGAPGDVELQIITAKGNTKWVRVIVEAEFADGKCLRVYGSIQDIDVRKKAEIASKEALEERNTILESIDDAFFAVDKNWIVTYWNNTAEKLFSTPKIEILNQSLLEKFPGWVGAEAYKKYSEVINTRQASRFEHKSIAFDLWLEISAYPAEGGLAVYIKDITNRKKAEALAIEALEERNTILESIDDAFFAVDKNWMVTYWNNTAEKVLMTPTDKILNHNLWEVFSESIDSKSYRKYHEAVETNQAAHFDDYFEPLNKWYEISAYPSETGLSVYFKDITDRRLSETLLRELNANLQKQTKELATSNAELEQFAYVASHDLQEPLRMVTSFLTQLEKKYGAVIDDKGKQYINFAVDGAKRMRQIILDLLDFSRIGRTEDDLEDVNFIRLVAEILALYRRQIEEENANITVESMPVIKTYKTPIRQVFQNLISNSLKYHRLGIAPEIHISCNETAKYFQFLVKDNGIGIASEYFDKIFIIFQRLHNKEEYSGTGMGLAIAKKIVESLGGKIWVESEEGKGSTFYFTLLKK
jgi:PAS domain S-box-containing protein